MINTISKVYENRNDLNGKQAADTRLFLLF